MGGDASVYERELERGGGEGARERATSLREPCHVKSIRPINALLTSRHLTSDSCTLLCLQPCKMARQIASPLSRDDTYIYTARAKTQPLVLILIRRDCRPLSHVRVIVALHHKVNQLFPGSRCRSCSSPGCHRSFCALFLAFPRSSAPNGVLSKRNRQI